MECRAVCDCCGRTCTRDQGHGGFHASVIVRGDTGDVHVFGSPNPRIEQTPDTLSDILDEAWVAGVAGAR